MIILELWNDVADLFWYEAFAVMPNDSIWFDVFFPFSDTSGQYNFRLLPKCQSAK